MSSPSSLDLLPPQYLRSTDSSHGFSNDPGSPISRNRSFRLPPPAITTFAYASSKSTYDLQRNPVLELHNKAHRLSLDLQKLLDYQSLALMGGIGRNGLNSRQPSQHSDLYEAPSPPRSNKHLKKRAIPLSDVRANILTAMEELAFVKSQETMLYSQLASERRQLVADIASHTSKTTRLRQELEKINESPEATRAESLRAQKSSVAGEIAVLRKRLSDLESEQTTIDVELTELDSVISSRSSSYKSALDSLSQRTTSFLSQHSQPSPVVASEVWTLEADAYDSKKEAAECEKDALEDGMALWGDAMDVVSGFEIMLRQKLSTIGGDSLSAVGPHLRSELARVTRELEDMVARADKARWKLLVVAIGAELQAFKEAGEVLKNHLQDEEKSGVMIDDGSPTDALMDHTEQLLDVSFDDADRRHRDYSRLDD